MSEQILKALMQLFAIIARPESNARDRRTIVESFLKRQLNQELVAEYLRFLTDITVYTSRNKKTRISPAKAISASSVRVLRICTEINEELAQPQKIIVLIQLLEFVKSDNDEITRQEMEFVTTVAETFNIGAGEYSRDQGFCPFFI